MKLLLATSLVALSASSAWAAPGDMKIGSFGDVFCGAPARFDIESQYPDTWVFRGNILIIDTNEYDAVRITQYEDNSLKITRELTGAGMGQKQTVQTGPPSIEQGEAVFRSSGGRGAGCNNAGAYTELRLPR